ncbi:PucR family transcriptional regulator [Nocardia gipuzkoensis]|uniref:PucR family transcriptional regulator n=1 Tax=Nocardia gipuzkoensis TaxID=2749991 RepID=UPI00237D496C|nr:helix-turn-helix domain-containing protein [Nocardia gipuzkoensis]MDE1674548.1 helix-turn-helix domain-containing protein [Nocardia gipuzkoensis]
MIEGIAHPAADPKGQPIIRPLPDVHRLAREVVTHVIDAAAPCRTLPNGAVGADVTEVVRACLQWAIQRLDGQAVPDRIDCLQAAAAGWAREGIPIDTVLHAVHAGFKFGLDLLFGDRGSRHRVDIATGAATVVELLNLLTGTVGKAYVREYKAIAAEHHTAVHTLTSALLGGHATSAMARECGIPIADEYFVLALAVPAHPDESRPGLDSQVVARRKLRRLQAALAVLFGDRALSLLSVDGGTILIPRTRPTAPGLDEVVETLSAAAQVPVTATVVPAGPDEVSTAAVQAHELLDTVQQLGRGPGLYRFAELALHYQLTRPGAGRDRLRTHLAPLMDHPELLETLRTHLDTGMHRLRTARRLHVHPNTVDYRLRRIAQLTSLDPADGRGVWYLRSALIAASAHSDPSEIPTGTRRPA